MNKETKGQKAIKKVMNDFLPTLVVSTEEIERYCGTLHSMYDYSIYNIIMASLYFHSMYDKYPEKFAPYGRWKKVNRYVKKGEKASYMLRPQRYKYEVENEDGEKEERTGTTFKPFAVFDISQTDGEPLVQEDLIKGEIDLKPEVLLKHLENQGYEIIRTDKILTRGSTDSKYIKVSTKMTNNEQISTAIHEYAHNLLGHFEREDERKIFELEAESVAYIVTTILGLENEKARLYINNWGGTVDDVKERALTIINVASQIYNEIKEL